MRVCQYCEGVLDVNENGLAFRIMLGGYDPAYAAHDVCEEAARGMQRDLSLHHLYCHLDACEWQPRHWRPWPSKIVFGAGPTKQADSESNLD
jgi:hypothetical protein